MSTNSSKGFAQDLMWNFTPRARVMYNTQFIPCPDTKTKSISTTHTKNNSIDPQIKTSHFRPPFYIAGYRVFCSEQEAEGRQGLHGVGLAIRETICCKSVYIHQLIDERLMSMRFELTGESVAINLVVAYAPTEAKPNTQLKEEYWKKLGHTVVTDSNEGMSVRTGRRKRADWNEDRRVW